MSGGKIWVELRLMGKADGEQNEDERKLDLFHEKKVKVEFPSESRVSDIYESCCDLMECRREDIVVYGGESFRQLEVYDMKVLENDRELAVNVLPSFHDGNYYHEMYYFAFVVRMWEYYMIFRNEGLLPSSHSKYGDGLGLRDGLPIPKDKRELEMRFEEFEKDVEVRRTKRLTRLIEQVVEARRLYYRAFRLISFLETSTFEDISKICPSYSLENYLANLKKLTVVMKSLAESCYLSDSLEEGKRICQRIIGLFERESRFLDQKRLFFTYILLSRISISMKRLEDARLYIRKARALKKSSAILLTLSKILKGAREKEEKGSCYDPRLGHSYHCVFRLAILKDMKENVKNKYDIFCHYKDPEQRMRERMDLKIRVNDLNDLVFRKNIGVVEFRIIIERDTGQTFIDFPRIFNNIFIGF